MLYPPWKKFPRDIGSPVTAVKKPFEKWLGVDPSRLC
jgi:hypothetical protein